MDEADAYCAWLTQQMAIGATLTGTGMALARRLGVARVQVRLPSEEEWEYVARSGRDGLRYPFGMVDNVDCRNADDTHIGAPSAVGAFSRGASRWRVEELSGNVPELTSSPWRGIYLSSFLRVVRGGSFSLSPRNVRSAFRQVGHPNGLGNLFGFRVVVAPASDL